jgi:crotonobetainyl-CoA:carnitine CoA-transferase CaiB-like acyl-CoA transferase
MMWDTQSNGGALAGLRVLDLSRILAGPSCTQLLGDLGADVLKVERPGHGDDTRTWGPPYAMAEDGTPTAESAYYMAANRNKRSITLDLASADGRDALLGLLETADVLIENYKVGDLARYGLAYADLKERFPRLVYCSITGFGQTGPDAHRAGYDFVVQGMGGVMSITGEPDGTPVKLGVGIADLYTGMHAAVAILAALRHRDRSGRGQMIDMALLDCQVAMLANVGVAHLVSGKVPVRHGNAHPNIVPYDVFPTADGHVILAVGNDRQYRALCDVAGASALGTDPRFATNPARIANRVVLTELLSGLTRQRTTADWIGALEAANVPCGPVRTVPEVFADPHVRARGMSITMPRAGVAGGAVPLIGSPIHLSDTPVTYRYAPPRLGEHDAERRADHPAGAEATS